MALERKTPEPSEITTTNCNVETKSDGKKLLDIFCGFIHRLYYIHPLRSNVATLVSNLYFIVLDVLFVADPSTDIERKRLMLSAEIFTSNHLPYSFFHTNCAVSACLVWTTVLKKWNFY